MPDNETVLTALRVQLTMALRARENADMSVRDAETALSRAKSRSKDADRELEIWNEVAKATGLEVIVNLEGKHYGKTRTFGHGH